MSDLQRTGTHGAMKVEACGISEMERLILNLLRNFCLQFSDPESFGVGQAYYRAEQVFGRSAGNLLVDNIGNLLEAIRRERTSHFNFADPRCYKCCRYVFQTEYAIILLIRAAQTNDRAKMQYHAEEITEKPDSPAVLLAGHKVGTLLMSRFAQSGFADLSTLDMPHPIGVKLH